MFLSASVRDKETKKHTVIQNDFYSTKSAFKKDLQGNGYTVLRISHKRDLKAQEYGFSSLAEIKNKKKIYEGRNRSVWQRDIDRLEEIVREIEKIDL